MGKNILKRIIHVQKSVNSKKKNYDEKTYPLKSVKSDFIGPSSYKNEVLKPSLTGGTTPTPAPDPVFSCIEFIGTKLLTGIGAAAWNTFYTEVINQGVTEMTQILEKLESIQSTLNELVKMYKNTTYETYINERCKLVAEMTNAQTYYNQQLEKLDPESEKATKVLNDWAKSYVGGNSALVQFENVIDWILGVKINQNNLYDIYDLYVYNTTAWEHTGYEFRENLRELDCAAIASNAVLTLLYIKQNPDIDDDVRELQINTVTKKLQQYYDYYEAHKVEEHNDKYICQIERTHFEMDKGFWQKDYNNHSWFKSGRDWDTENAESSWCLLWGDDEGTIAGNNCGKQLYREELNRIKNYYGGEKSYWDIFIDVLGYELPEGCTKDNSVIPLCTWVSDVPDGIHERYQSFGECVTGTDSGITKQQIGTVYTEHTGFLWLTLTFRRWSWLSSKKFLFTKVTWRDEDNWKA